MFRILVVDSNTIFYKDYLLRFFKYLLPMDEIEITHTSDIESSIPEIVKPWDVILMSFNLGKKGFFFGDPIRTGADLITLRRALELDKYDHSTRIIGIAPNSPTNIELYEKGADQYVPKNNVDTLADYIRNEMDKKAIRK